MIDKIKITLKKMLPLYKTVQALQQDLENLRVEIYRLELQRQDAIKSMMHTRWLITRRETNSVTFNQKIVEVKNFNEYLDKFKSLYPHLFETWAAINLGTNMENYRDRPESSCSVASHEVASLFRGFIAPYLHGRVLDIGCGPYSVPKYLEGYPPSLVSGIDPLTPFDEHPFEFVQGFAEFLPWEDSTFDVVIAATSLDHVLSLDLARSEIIRVLKPEGVFLVWEGFIKGSLPYEPSDANLKLADDLHLFHFDEQWFEEYWSEYHVLEKINVNGASFFYAIQKSL